MAGRKARVVDLSRYPKEADFQTLLSWHLAWGTRPGCDTSRRNRKWVNATFATLVHEEGLLPSSASRGLRNWTNKGRLPDEHDEDKIARIFRELFGDDAALEQWKRDLERALQQGREAQRVRAFSPRNRSAKLLREPTSVPLPTTHFCGRKIEVDTIVDALASSQHLAVLLQSGPGIGKSELTKAVAHDPIIEDLFEGRRWFIPLSTATSAELMREAIFRGLQAEPWRGLSNAFGKDLEKPKLIILDNLETPWEPLEERSATEGIFAELQRIPNLHLLASFRGRDLVSGANWHPYFLDTLSVAASKDMFSRVAGSWVRSDPQLENFIDALGGIPLAIELVARRAYGRDSLDPLWREWGKIGSAFAVNPRLPPGRLTSLNVSIEFSLNSTRLNDAAFRLFGILGSLPDGLRRDNIETLLGRDAYEAQESLFNAGLAIHRRDRLDLLPPIRDYASTHCKPSPLDEQLIIDVTFRSIMNCNYRFLVMLGIIGAGNFQSTICKMYNLNKRLMVYEIIVYLGIFCILPPIGNLLFPALLPLLNGSDEIDWNIKGICFYWWSYSSYKSGKYEAFRRQNEIALSCFNMSNNASWVSKCHRLAAVIDLTYLE